MTYDWFSQLSPQTLVLTPNSRLARFLHAEFIATVKHSAHPAHPAHSAHSAHSVISTPLILPIETWLRDVYGKALFTLPNYSLLLTDVQETRLWETIVPDSLLQPEQAAQLLQKTYHALLHWNLTLTDLPNDDSADHLFFYNLVEKFILHCQKQNVLCSAELPTKVSEFFQLYPRELPTHIILHEFDELTPQQESFFLHLTALGCSITRTKNSLLATEQHRVTCETQATELLTMARWAKGLYEENPEQRITCVIPNLTELRPAIITTFNNVFKSNVNPKSIFNVSGGDSLANAPIIHAALLILQQNNKIGYQDLTILLTSPFVNGWQPEQFARAQFDFYLREKFNSTELSWDFVEKQITQKFQLSCQLLLKQINQFFAQIKDLPKTALLSEWSHIFYQRLATFGWPGERTLNSEEYQHVQRWFELLTELETIDITDRVYSYHEALQLLARLTRQTIFAIQTIDGPIQILGLLEAAGTRSDALWIMNLDDKTLPAVAKPSPFIPAYFQREHNMPHSSAQRELTYAKNLLKNFQYSANTIIYSYHQHDEDRNLTLSPLVSNIPEISVNNLRLVNYEPVAEKMYAIRKLETLFDEKGIDVTTTETIRGGTHLIKSQATCPFQAFARYRLGATRLTEPTLGLSYQERGQIIHRALELVWGQLKTQKQLLSYEETELKNVVAIATQIALTEFMQDHPEKIGMGFQSLEIIRLTRIIMQWLALEKKRPPFTVVAEEKRQSITLGTLTLNMSMDRVDQLTDDNILIMDYKTGEINISDWVGKRPNEPQLPLYALTQPAVTALAFAQLKTGKLKILGLSENNTDIDGIKLFSELKSRKNDEPVPETWEALLTQWYDVMTHLANDFMQGHAQVDPKDIQKSCGQCDLHSLCRIHERREITDVD